MKSKDLVFLLIVGVLGYVLWQRLATPTVGTAQANLSGGAAPAGTPSLAGQISGIASSVMSAIGSFGQTTPKTT